MQRLLILTLAVLCAVSCGRRNPSTQGQDVALPKVFLPALAPAELSPEEQRDYLRWHYWDRFDFADTLFLAQADTLRMLEDYARYIAVISDRPTDPAPMDTLMRRASASRPMLDYFAMLADKVLHVIVLAGHQMSAAQVEPLQLREPAGELFLKMHQRTLQLVG